MLAVAEPNVHTSKGERKWCNRANPTNEMMNKQQARRKKHKKAIDGEENENLIDFLVSRALTWLLLNQGDDEEERIEKHLKRGDDDVSVRKELENEHEKLTLIRKKAKKWLKLYGCPGAREKVLKTPRKFFDTAQCAPERT
jgi:hypothetical protein